jgi:hypothetical protein
MFIGNADWYSSARDYNSIPQNALHCSLGDDGGFVDAAKISTDRKKFRTVAIFFTIALVLILLAMPSPISPFAVRPWMRLDF